MFKKFLILFALTVVFNACSLDDDDNLYYSIETLPIKEAIVPAEFEFGSFYDITVTYDLPSSCHFFDQLYYEYEGTSRIVAVNAGVLENTDCEDSITEKEFTFTVRVEQVEDYLFKFWNGKDNSGNDIFIEILVPVVEP